MIKLDPELGCTICGTTFALHVGDLDVAEWNHLDPITITSRTDARFELAIATENDIDILLSTPEIFVDMAIVPEVLKAFTQFNGRSYPYVIFCKLDGQVVGKMFLDRNSNNAIRRSHRAAICDSIIVHPDFRRIGVCDSMLAYAEELALKNGIKWMEIGVVPDNSGPLHSYMRRGYYHDPALLTRELAVHYRVQGLPDDATALCPRYEPNALVVYKDLNSVFALRPNKLDKKFGDYVRAMG